jgi:hypothetical protein
MNQNDPGRTTAFVAHETGYDVDGLLREMEDLPQKFFGLRQKLSPLRAEKGAIDDRFASRGRSPSMWDVERSLLLSELKEEARELYNRSPQFREDSKGNQVKIELTDGRAEDIAHAHPRYRKFVQESIDERRRARELGKQIGKIYDRLEAWKRRSEYIKLKLEQIKAETYLLNGQARL